MRNRGSYEAATIKARRTAEGKSLSTEQIAIAIGGYGIAAGIGVLRHPAKFQDVYDGLRDNPALAFMTGLIVYFLGAAVLISGGDWSSLLGAMIAIFGWGAIIEGLGFLLGPGAFVALVKRAGVATSPRLWGWLYIIVGAAYMIVALAA